MLDLLLRAAHILGAAALIGGATLWRMALVDAVAALPEASRGDFLGAVRGRWSKVVMSASGILLVTGMVNFLLVVMRYDLDKSVFPGSKYHMLFGIKFLLALAAFLLAALLTGRTAAAERLRANARFWLNVQLALAVAIVLLGGLLKQADRRPKAVSSAQAVPGSASLVSAIATQG